jgi:hypothetical protein
MADIRASFAVLEDSSTSAGLALHRVLQGDALAAKNAAAVLGFKDASNNLRYPTVDSQDRVNVNVNSGDYASLWERGELVAGSATMVDVTGAVITLQASTNYDMIQVVVSSRRDSHFQIVQTDDATDTIIADILVEAGDSCEDVSIDIPFTSGATGTQELKVMGMNFSVLSALRATIKVREEQ